MISFPVAMRRSLKKAVLEPLRLMIRLSCNATTARSLDTLARTTGIQRRPEGRTLEDAITAIKRVTQKCGTSYVEGVLPYGERLKVKGLNLLSAPGNDLVAATALASCGCHMVLFTTGRGTPFGTYVPTMKISTNSTLAKNKPGWIDFNAGVIVENEPMKQTCERFIEYIIKVASGEFVNNEKKGYKEIAIFKTGVTL